MVGALAVPVAGECVSAGGLTRGGRNARRAVRNFASDVGEALAAVHQLARRRLRRCESESVLPRRKQREGRTKLGATRAALRAGNASIVFVLANASLSNSCRKGRVLERLGVAVPSNEGSWSSFGILTLALQNGSVCRRGAERRGSRSTRGRDEPPRAGSYAGG